MFSYFQNTFLLEHLWRAASVFLKWKVMVRIAVEMFIDNIPNVLNINTEDTRATSADVVLVSTFTYTFDLLLVQCFWYCWVWTCNSYYSGAWIHAESTLRKTINEYERWTWLWANLSHCTNSDNFEHVFTFNSKYLFKITN